LIEIANKLTLGMARVNHMKKDVLAMVPAWLPHLPGTLHIFGEMVQKLHVRRKSVWTPKNAERPGAREGGRPVHGGFISSVPFAISRLF
jgi:hypothetical protein